LLQLSDSGRTLAFDHSGDYGSLIVVVFYHGVFGVGNANSSRRSRVFDEKHVHFVTPTLPGWGRTSPPSSSTPSYTDTLTSDLTALIHHLYPDPSTRARLQIFVSGGSFGTVAAQIIYGQPLDKFPLGRCIRGLLLLSPFSKPGHGWDPNFNSSLDLGSWLMMGSPSHYVPFNMLPRLLSTMFKTKFTTIESAEQMIRTTLFDRMDEAEKREFDTYRREHSLNEGQLEREFAVNAWRSVQMGMDGFTGLNQVMHEDWGFRPQEIDPLGRRVLIYAAKGDTLAPNAQAYWLRDNYRNSELILLDGGHIVVLTKMEEIWTSFLREMTI